MTDIADQLRVLASAVEILDAANLAQAEIITEQARRNADLVAELDACKNPSPFELLFEEDWSAGIDPARWFISPGVKYRPDHAAIVAGELRLEVREDADGWHGALVGIRDSLALTYGKFEFDGYLESGSFLGCALLWPQKPYQWPQDGEVDFFEINAGSPSRLTNPVTLHYGSNPNHPMIHRTYTEDFTQTHTIGVEWTPGLLDFTCDGVLRSRIEDPNVPARPMKLNLQSQAPDPKATNPITPTDGALVIEAARVYSWKAPAE